MIIIEMFLSVTKDSIGFKSQGMILQFLPFYVTGAKLIIRLLPRRLKIQGPTQVRFTFYLTYISSSYFLVIRLVLKSCHEQSVQPTPIPVGVYYQYQS